ncbi:peptidase M20 domain-containing protein 2 [Caerostris darwini]|uniref:Peptidase M20 domain-containing protein 2 n=1 Tax=Caerostris darwini TaxID=1538125 RepID=A0AAV4RXD4_9ARAC|nr:peptidase M20 domain-containing protein 2 [Caerostris darwini]
MSDEDFRAVKILIDEHAAAYEITSDTIVENSNGTAVYNFFLSCLRKQGFEVEDHYVMRKAFRAVFSPTPEDEGPVIALLVEFDTLLGLSCAHNLALEAVLAACDVIQHIMKADPELKGKIIVFGAIFSNEWNWKNYMLEEKAFLGVDVAIMVQPSNVNCLAPSFNWMWEVTAYFNGEASHATLYPREGRSALDAAVSAYHSLSLLKQHIQPPQMINVIIQEGGDFPNLTPEFSLMEVAVKAADEADLERLVTSVETCISSATKGARCNVTFVKDTRKLCQPLLTNHTLVDVFRSYAYRLGMKFTTPSLQFPITGTDLGNLSHVLPCICPIFDIYTDAPLYSMKFQDAARREEAQQPTLRVAKALAMTALKLMRCPKTLAEVKEEFPEEDPSS